MKVNVDESKCLGCGKCVATTNEKIFDFNDDGFAVAVVDVVEENDVDIVKEAIEDCPTSAIYIEE